MKSSACQKCLKAARRLSGLQRMIWPQAGQERGSELTGGPRVFARRRLNRQSWPAGGLFRDGGLSPRMPAQGKSKRCRRWLREVIVVANRGFRSIQQCGQLSAVRPGTPRAGLSDGLVSRSNLVLLAPSKERNIVGLTAAVAPIRRPLCIP
jgi:hypothetical protein